MIRCIRILTLTTILSLLASVSSAMQMTIDIAGGVGAEDVTAAGSVTGPNTEGVVFWNLLDTPYLFEGGIGQINSWTVQMKDDPFVTNNINVSNNSNADQTFISTVFLPITAFNYNEWTGSMAVSVTDSDGAQGLSLDRDDPFSVYEARINGALALSLDFDSLPITEADCQPFTSNGCSASASKNQPLIAAGPGNANDIALTLRFVLSPGDSASFTSRFEIVPEPTTALLLGLGLTALGVASRRRH